MQPKPRPPIPPTAMVGPKPRPPEPPAHELPYGRPQPRPPTPPLDELQRSRPGPRPPAPPQGDGDRPKPTQPCPATEVLRVKPATQPRPPAAAIAQSGRCTCATLSTRCFEPPRGARTAPTLWRDRSTALASSLRTLGYPSRCRGSQTSHRPGSRPRSVQGPRRRCRLRPGRCCSESRRCTAPTG